MISFFYYRLSYLHYLFPINVHTRCLSLIAAVCTVTPTATLPRACCAWSSKKPGRASTSESWTKDKLVARTSSSISGRASLSDNWIRDKTQRKETDTEHVERVPSREIISQIRAKDEKKEICVERAGGSPSREISQVGVKRALSQAPSVEVDEAKRRRSRRRMPWSTMLARRS